MANFAPCILEASPQYPDGDLLEGGVAIIFLSARPCARLICICVAGLSERIGPVQRPSADSFSMVINPKGGLGSPSPCGTLTTSTHPPRSRRLLLGGGVLLSLVGDASH